MLGLSPVRYDYWYSYDELTAWLRQVAEARPDLCALISLGATPEGRDIWMLQVTDFSAGAPEDKPIFLVHGNIHAKELAGATSALQLIHALLSDQAKCVDLRALLGDVAFCVVPRLNPDGAEFALTTGGEIRSRLEEQRVPNGLYQHDLDGDGWIVSMRVQRPDGDMKLSADDPRLLVPREPTDHEGVFYRVYPEGLIHEYDGGDFAWHSRGHDFNRNWPANWRQEHEQGGAGDYPFSEPEMAALAHFVYSHPTIFGILGFHCGTSAILTPPSTGSEDDIPARDREVFRRLSERAAELTGFGIRATINYRHDSQPPIALCGHSADWGYQHMGLFHYEIELGNIYNAAGVTEQQYFAAEPRDCHLFDREAIRYHDEHPEYAIFVDWHNFDHPQLGPVEIGGWKRFWLINPSLERLCDRIAPGAAQFIIEYADRRPRLAITEVTTDRFGDVFRVRARVANTGSLPTNITDRALQLRSLKPVEIALTADGPELLSRHSHFTLDHIQPNSRSRECEWFLRTTRPTQVTISARAQRAVGAQLTLALG